MPAGITIPGDLARHIPKRSWILRSKARVRLVAAAAGLTVAGSTSAADAFFYSTGKSAMIMMVASDVLAGLLSALVIIAVLDRIVDRGQTVRARLEMIAEMNHHVRNALQVIAFSASSIQDKQAIAKINDASEHIEWALREILGSAGFDVPTENKRIGKRSA